MENLTLEELRTISLEKNKYGVATKKALRAQRIIWERAGKPYNSSYFTSNHKKHTSSNYSYLA